jgi:hypothetical protein
MAQNRQSVFLQRENDKGVTQGWQTGWVEIDSMGGTVNVTPRGILGGKWSVTLRPDMVTTFTIIMISDVNTMSMMYGGGLLGYGIALLMSRWAKMPALKFEQPSAEMGQRMLTLRSAGFQPRKKTRELANQFANLLRERGSKAMMPDLADDTAWKFPIVALLVGLGLVIALCVVLIVVSYLLNPSS